MWHLWDSYRNRPSAPSHSYALTAMLPCSIAQGFCMYDVIYLVLGVGGFAVCLGFVHLCDRL